MVELGRANALHSVRRRILSGECARSQSPRIYSGSRGGRAARTARRVRVAGLHDHVSGKEPRPRARKALDESRGMVPHSASQGIGQNGCFHSRVDRLEFPSKYNAGATSRNWWKRPAPAMTASDRKGSKQAAPAAGTDKTSHVSLSGEAGDTRSATAHLILTGFQWERISAGSSERERPSSGCAFRMLRDPA